MQSLGKTDFIYFFIIIMILDIVRYLMGLLLLFLSLGRKQHNNLMVHFGYLQIPNLRTKNKTRLK